VRAEVGRTDARNPICGSCTKQAANGHFFQCTASTRTRRHVIVPEVATDRTWSPDNANLFIEVATAEG
jgi:hypothetical protein